MSLKCKFCSSKIDNNYCKTCRAHFKFKNNTQIYTSVEIDKLNYSSIQDRLCIKCTKYYATNCVIYAYSFIDYIKKLKFCRSCKKENEKFIRNMFYNNFIMYRFKKRIYNNFYLFFTILIFLLFKSNFLFYSITYLILYSWNFKDLIFFILGWYGNNNFAINIIFILYNIYIILFRKRDCFKMPNNLETVKDMKIEEHIRDLHLE